MPLQRSGGVGQAEGCHDPLGSHLHPRPPARLAPLQAPAMPLPLCRSSAGDGAAGSSRKDNDTWAPRAAGAATRRDLGRNPRSRRSDRQRRRGGSTVTQILIIHGAQVGDRRFTRGGARQECAGGKRRSDQHKGTWKQGWDVLEDLGGLGRAAGQQRQHPLHIPHTPLHTPTHLYTPLHIPCTPLYIPTHPLHIPLQEGAEHWELGGSQLPGPARRCVALPGECLNHLLFLQEPVDADECPLGWDSPTFTHHMVQAASPSLAQYLGVAFKGNTDQHTCCGIIILQSLTTLPPYPSPSQK